MAKTAVVNRRRKKTTNRKRRRNTGAAASNPSKRRRRRNPGTAAAPRRRSNARRKNPGIFDTDSLMDTLPSATGGVLMSRWAVKQAGDFELVGPKGAEYLAPSWKHALAILVAASYGGELIGNVLGSAQKGEYARIAALGYGGDLFYRTRFARDSEWSQNNLNLDGLGEDEEVIFVDEDGNQVDAEGNLMGFEATSPLGEYVSDEAGNVYQLDGGDMGADYPANYRNITNAAAMGGFEATSPLGMAPADAGSNSFGYSSRG